jgi:hypothetical protein
MEDKMKILTVANVSFGTGILVTGLMLLTDKKVDKTTSKVIVGVAAVLIAISLLIPLADKMRKNVVKE